MIKVVVTSNSRAARITQGEPRQVCQLVEEHIRLLDADSRPFIFDVVGPAFRAGDVARVKAYLADVMRELAADEYLRREAVYAEAKAGGPQEART